MSATGYGSVVGIVLGTLTFILLSLREQGRKRRRWQALALLCAAEVLLSTSTTSTRLRRSCLNDSGITDDPGF